MSGIRITQHVRGVLALAALGVALACGHAGDAKKADVRLKISN